jgi:DNA-binding transcriptional MocR family regulator
VATISFARGIPAPECLPVSELADCAKGALERDGSVALSYGSTLGYAPLREWLAERHGVEPGRVLVTNGSLQAFHFVLESLGGEGLRVLVERPTYDRPRKILAAASVELGEIRSTPKGSTSTHSSRRSRGRRPRSCTRSRRSRTRPARP